MAANWIDIFVGKRPLPSGFICAFHLGPGFESQVHLTLGLQVDPT